MFTGIEYSGNTLLDELSLYRWLSKNWAYFKRCMVCWRFFVYSRTIILLRKMSSPKRTSFSVSELWTTSLRSVRKIKTRSILDASFRFLNNISLMNQNEVFKVHIGHRAPFDVIPLFNDLPQLLLRVVKYLLLLRLYLTGLASRCLKAKYYTWWDTYLCGLLIIVFSVHCLEIEANRCLLSLLHGVIKDSVWWPLIEIFQDSASFRAAGSWLCL